MSPTVRAYLWVGLAALLGALSLARLTADTLDLVTLALFVGAAGFAWRGMRAVQVIQP